MAGNLLNCPKTPHMNPRMRKTSEKLPLFPLRATDLWHFIIVSDPPQLSGHTSTDSLTVCLNSGWRLCFHSPGWTPSASSSITEIIPAPRDALVEWCSLLVCGYGSVGLCTHTNLKSTVVGKLSCVYGNGNDMEKESRPLVDLAPDEAMCKLKLLTLKAPYPQISLMSCVFFSKCKH